VKSEKFKFVLQFIVDNKIIAIKGNSNFSLFTLHFSLLVKSYCSLKSYGHHVLK
jgi:hypothetical protein